MHVCVYFLKRTDPFPTIRYILPVSISWLPVGTYAPISVASDSDIFTISATCESDYRHVLSGDTCRSCTTHPQQSSSGQDGRKTPLFSPPLLSPRFQCDTFTDSFPSCKSLSPTFYPRSKVTLSWSISGGHLLTKA